jgi:hypothetical protein
MTDLEPFHLCFIDVYRDVSDHAPYILVRSGGDVPRHLEDQGVRVDALELKHTRQPLTRSAYRWGQPGVRVHRLIQEEGACIVTPQALREGKRLFIIRHGLSAAVGGLLSFGLAWYLTGLGSSTGKELTTLLLASSLLIGAFMGWEGAAAFEEETPEHLHMDYGSKIFPNDRSQGPPGSGT